MTKKTETPHQKLQRLTREILEAITDEALFGREYGPEDVARGLYSEVLRLLRSGDKNQHRGIMAELVYHGAMHYANEACQEQMERFFPMIELRDEN